MSVRTTYRLQLGREHDPRTIKIDMLVPGSYFNGTLRALDLCTRFPSPPASHWNGVILRPQTTPKLLYAKHIQSPRDD